MSKTLADFAQNVYSQNGEDGIISEIFNRLSGQVNSKQWCVEFGAWDGIHLSNTARLIRELGYKAVLIEGDSTKVAELRTNFPDENVIAIEAFVDFEGANSLDNILERTPIPRDFDLLSIDVDGVDYHIFDSLRRFIPKVVCIEFNPTIPNEVEFIQPKDFSKKQGSSAAAIVKLAKKKNYSLVAATYCNLIFVRDDLRNFVVDEQQSLTVLNPRGNNATQIFVGYDGTILSNSSSIRLPWHKLDIPLDEFQVLPRIFRIFPSDYGVMRHLGFKVHRFRVFLGRRVRAVILRWLKKSS